MATVHNNWEVAAMQHTRQPGSARRGHESANDPLIYPGLYTRSGLNIIAVLARVFSRPDPRIDFGPVDGSCAIIVCALTVPDQPIIYASPAFLEMTGYKMNEVLGKNCRFLQSPDGRVRAKSTRLHIENDTVTALKSAVDSGEECQMVVPNFKKDGTAFNNYLTIIPIKWHTEDYVLSVGFQCNLDDLEA